MEPNTQAEAAQPQSSSDQADQAQPIVKKSTFPVVGLGASAGGLQALQQFFAAMPANNGMAFVVIMHLSPNHESHAAAILQQSTVMPVFQVNETVVIAPETVYVIPPAHHLTMDDGMIRLTKSERPVGRHIAIDLFFRTLADTHTTSAACIVLSGTGSDGSVGIQRAKEAGGITLVQDPLDAQYDTMPRNAINTGVIDFVLPASKMPEQLLTVWRNASQIKLPAEAEPSVTDETKAAEEALHEILTAVRVRTGHDFTHYKRATILRRLERRMQVTTTPHLPAYNAYLHDHPGEITLLLQDLLIGVTNFFRNRDSFDALEQLVIPQLFEGKTTGDTVRTWVVGCASGEEAYSVAILMLQYAARLPHPPAIQVFATDIDEQAIQVAREGSYPEAIETDVTPARLQQYFTKEVGGYRVTKALRECVLFAAHNLINDPPFLHLDLLTCRNLLIYLNRNVQEQVFELFHFALRSRKFLFLGSSESLDGASDMFEIIDKKHRLFQSSSVARTIRTIPTLSVTTPGSRALRQHEGASERRRVAFGELHQQIVEEYAPPSIIVNGDLEILHLSEHAGRFTRFVGGEPSLNLLKVVLPELRLELRTALYQAFQTGKSTEARRVQLARDNRITYVNIVVRPTRHFETQTTYALVLFDEVEDILGTEGIPTATAANEPVVQHLEAEIQRLKGQLEATTDQYGTSVEELKAANEELQAINEELRATTEELETSKEELQSVNEELHTVNQELKLNVDDLSETNNDLKNLMSATDIATIFVDRSLRITRYTPRTLDLFNLIPSDEGRQLEHITHRLEYSTLLTDITTVLRNVKPIEREVGSRAGRYYLARLVPYRTVNDAIAGVVLTFVEITERRQAEQALRISEQRYRALFTSMTEAFAICEIVLDAAGTPIDYRLLDINPAYEVMGGINAKAVGEKTARELFPATANAWIETFGQVVNSGQPIRFEYNNLATQRWFTVFAFSLAQLGAGKFALLFLDITARKQAEAELSAAYALEQTTRIELEAALQTRDQFLSVASHELRTPLTSLVGYTQLLRKNPARSSADIERMTSRILRQSERLNNLIGHLLDVSRLQRGQFVIEQQRFDIALFAEQLVEEFRETLPASPAYTITFTGPEQSAFVVGDGPRLEQVLFNLLSNAVKYSPDGGLVSVAVAVNSNEIRITVADQGMGISVAAQAHLFEPFYRAHDSEYQTTGFGLGLYIAKEIVERHQGTITVESSEGIGSTFTVVLPVARE